MHKYSLKERKSIDMFGKMLKYLVKIRQHLENARKKDGSAHEFPKVSSKYRIFGENVEMFGENVKIFGKNSKYLVKIRKYLSKIRKITKNFIKLPNISSN